ncbi:diguanylate cyclase domain-containing protein [Rhodanobacter lindaniclasticus]
MLNREHIFEQIDAHIHASAGERFAVLTLRVPGLREISLRFGYSQGEQAEDMAHALIQRSLRPIDRVFRAGDDSFVVLLPAMLSANHDPIVRHELQDQLWHIFGELGKTVIVVTHDLTEAVWFAPRLVLLRRGAVVQDGSYADLRDRPANDFVRQFVQAQRTLPAAP